MTTVADPDTTTARPGVGSGRLETDTFCAYCGYNLFSQPVTRDANLGILVCRCPECGRFHAAGSGVVAGKLWLSRLATGLLAIWLIGSVVVTGLCMLGMGAMDEVLYEGLTVSGWYTAGGIEVPYYFRQYRDSRHAIVATQPTNYYYGGLPAGVTPGEPVYQMTKFRTWDSIMYERRQVTAFEAWGLADFLLSFILGAIWAACQWHWRRRRWLALLVPIIAALGVFLFDPGDEHTGLRPGFTALIFASAAVQAVLLALGLLLGRPIVRLLLRIFITPRLRQHFAILWLIDGRPPPPAAVKLPNV